MFGFWRKSIFRYIFTEAKAIGISSAKLLYPELYGEELKLPKCLEVIAAHCCYLSCPFLSGLERDELKTKMNNLKSDIRWTRSYLGNVLKVPRPLYSEVAAVLL